MKSVRRFACKQRDSWWTVILVDPVAIPLVYWVARFTRITPNQITWLSFLAGLGAAACFFQGAPEWLVLGALVYHASFILDCMDGKLARIRGNGSLFGGWLDYMLDRVSVLCCALALGFGQWLRHDEPGYLLLAAAVGFVDLLRYLNGIKVNQVRATMRADIRSHPAFGDTEPPVFIEHLMRDRRKRGIEPSAVNGAVIDLHKGFRHTFPWYGAARDRLLRSRIRPHLISGIEFQMAVFVIGPLLGHVVAPVVVAGVPLLCFELGVVYKLLLSTRDFRETICRLDAKAAEHQAASGAGNADPVSAPGCAATPAR
ncbi:CDP-alcohol phosphatidyltransferase family protein [Streptomyces sp. NPDC059193]|uniref:CDP-alcohol phosphatidyltransferase family protein n=1 Tax=Streptomyces sp. NPDC059193 TaxID=3346763 RepID=UPI0036996CFD